jgi:hypothetical protein
LLPLVLAGPSSSKNPGEPAKTRGRSPGLEEIFKKDPGERPAKQPRQISPGARGGEFVKRLDSLKSIRHTSDINKHGDTNGVIK